MCPFPHRFMPKTVISENISAQYAKEISKKAQLRAKELGIPVVIAIADTRGALKYLLAMDDAPPRSVDIAFLKAKTSALTGKKTADLKPLVQSGAKLEGITETNGGMTVIEGGFPIQIDGKLIGGLGISGGDAATQDPDIAAYALQ